MCALRERWFRRSCKRIFFFLMSLYVGSSFSVSFLQAIQSATLDSRELLRTVHRPGELAEQRKKTAIGTTMTSTTNIIMIIISVPRVKERGSLTGAAVARPCCRLGHLSRRGLRLLLPSQDSNKKKKAKERNHHTRTKGSTTTRRRRTAVSAPTKTRQRRRRRKEVRT